MFGRTLQIISSGFKMAMQELLKNKLRTFLSLFGITIGIFCIISVLATVSSLERNIQNELKSLGTNTLYLDKWDYTAGGGPDYPWWKYVNRPVPKFAEVKFIKEKTPDAKYVAFRIKVTDDIGYQNSLLTNVNIYGVSRDFEFIQQLLLSQGRYISTAEFDRGLPVVVIGNTVAEKLFGDARFALDKTIDIRGKKLTVTGVISKQGNQIIGGWNFDESVIIPYRFARTMMNERKADPLIMVQGKTNVSSKVLKNNITGVVRAVHKLPPTKENNFTLNDINDFSETISSVFKNVNIGGWAIAALSLIVGMFGVANIMFVSVRERTNQIGIKKALGAKRRVILSEFLMESAFLCILGGIIGLLLVFGLTILLTHVLDFPVFISTTNMAMAIFICIFVGVVAGYIPARQAAKMDPAVAIRE